MKGKRTMEKRLVRRARVFAAGLLGAAGVSVGVIGLGAAGASAAPGNAKLATTGMFECESLESGGTFVINTGNSHAPVVAWSAAQLTFQHGPLAGRTAVFQPRQYNFFNEGLMASKNGPGSTECAVTVDGILLGKVTGQVTFTP
jgi:hypothetical protein